MLNNKESSPSTTSSLKEELGSASKLIDSASKQLLSVQQSIEQKVVEIQRLEENWNSKCKLMEELAQKASSTIKLNIGGKLFQTSKDTLLSNKDTFFFAMISSGNWLPGEDGTYFIDRNPKLFPYILDLLRYGKVNLSKLDKNQLELLKVEADYYLVNELMFPETFEEINETFDTTTKGTTTILSESNKRAHAYYTNHTSAIGVNGISSGKRTWKLRINQLTKPINWISVGVICKPITNLQNTFKNPTNYSITSDNQKFSAGQESSSTASGDWSFGDIVQIDIDCELHTLTIKNLNTGRSEWFENLPVNTYYLHVNLFNSDDSVTIV